MEVNLSCFKGSSNYEAEEKTQPPQSGEHGFESPISNTLEICLQAISLEISILFTKMEILSANT